MISKPIEPAVTDYLYRKASRNGIALSGTFELTPLCNMNCKMCYVRLAPEQQAAIAPLADATQWISLGQRAKNNGMLYLLLTGGEPLLHPQFPEILYGLHRMGLLISINTNGTLIDEAAAEILKQSPPARVNVTLYGASNETYRRLCGNGEGYSKAVRGIKLLMEAGISVKINYSITPDNVQDLPGVIDFCKENGLVLQTNAYMFPPVRKSAANIGDNFRFSPEEAAYYTALSELLMNGEKAFLSRKITVPECTDECAEVGEGVRCRAGRCSFWVTWNGRLLPCGMFDSHLAPNVFLDDFAEGWSRIKMQVAEIRLPAKCAGCHLLDSCRACAAMVYTETGSFTQIPRYRCQMSHAFLPQRERLKSNLLAGLKPTIQTEG